MTTLSSIARLLALQKSAYELLLWLGARARTDQLILSDENLAKWSVGPSCETWIRANLASFPVALRPVEEDVPALANLFSSFFSTSFHISETTTVPDRYGSGYYDTISRRSLVAGAPSTGKKSAKGKAKIVEGARELELIALEALALESELFPSRAQLQALLLDPILGGEMTIWTYFHELERRSRFSSQGASVHRLWLELNETERKNLDPARIWNARERLLDALQSN